MVGLNCFFCNSVALRYVWDVDPFINHPTAMRTLLLSFLILGLSVPAFGQSAEQIQQGIGHFDAGRFDEAKRVFEGIIKSNSKHAQGTFYLGRIAMKQGDWKSAVSLLEKAAEYDETKADYQYYLSESVFTRINEVGALKKMGLARKGRTALEACITLDPGYAGCHESLVYFHQEAPGIVGGDVKDAEKHAKLLQELQPKNGGLVLARFYTGQEQYEAAQKVLNDLEKSFSNDVEVHYQIGMYHQNQKDFEKAFLSFQKAVDLNESAALASLYQIGRNAVFSNQHIDEGIAALRQYQTYEPGRNLPSKASALWRLGMLHELKDSANEARAAYTEALQLEPDHEQAKEALRKLK